MRRIYYKFEGVAIPVIPCNGRIGFPISRIAKAAGFDGGGQRLFDQMKEKLIKDTDYVITDEGIIVLPPGVTVILFLLKTDRAKRLSLFLAQRITTDEIAIINVYSQVAEIKRLESLIDANHSARLESTIRELPGDVSSVKRSGFRVNGNHKPRIQHPRLGKSRIGIPDAAARFGVTPNRVSRIVKSMPPGSFDEVITRSRDHRAVKKVLFDPRILEPNDRGGMNQ